LRVSGQPGSNVSASAVGNPIASLSTLPAVYPAAAAQRWNLPEIGLAASKVGGRRRSNNKKPLFFRPILGIAAANAGLN